MDIRDYVRAIRKRWMTIVVTTLICIGVAATLTSLAPKTYQSSMQFFVSTSSGAQGGSNELLQGSTFTQQRVKSYGQLVSTPKVLDPVIQELGLDKTGTELQRQVTATVPLDTVLIEVDVTSEDPAEAEAIATAISEQFPGTVADLERVADGERSPVKVTLVMTPTLAETPISPRPVLNLLAGGLIGLLLGLVAAVIRDQLDSTVKGEAEAREVTDRTVLGGITFDPDATKNPLIVQADPRNPRAEAFRTLRTNLQFVDATEHPRTIVVTSSMPGEGKTTTTANLALTLAQTGSTVVVIEGDLRRPRLLTYMGLEGAVGITDVLIGHADLEDVMQPFAESNLSVIGAGQLPPNPSELLGSTGMRDTLAQLAMRYDYVLIDAPPVLPVTDAAVLSTICDGVVVVVGAGKVAKEQLSRALDTLDAVNANVLGIVLNRLPRRGSNNTYYAYDYEPETNRGRALSRAASSGDRRARTSVLRDSRRAEVSRRR